MTWFYGQMQFETQEEFNAYVKNCQMKFMADHIAKVEPDQIKYRDVWSKGDPARSLHGAASAFDDARSGCDVDHQVIPDQVNHPSHYTSGPIECWDAMCSAFGPAEMMIYAKVAAFKYLWRAGKKGPQEVDFEKAQWYLAKRKLLENQPKGLNNADSTKGVNP